MSSCPRHESVRPPGTGSSSRRGTCPRRHLRDRRRRARGGRRRDRRHAPRVPVPGLLDRGPARARRAWLPDRALPDHAVSGKTTWEHVFEGVRVGMEQSPSSSDCGNPITQRSRTASHSGRTGPSGSGFGEDETREMIVVGIRSQQSGSRSPGPRLLQYLPLTGYN